MPEDSTQKNAPDVSMEKDARHQAFLDQVLEANLDDFYRAVLDGLQLSILIVEQDAHIVDSNATAAKLLATDRKLLLRACSRSFD